MGNPLTRPVPFHSPLLPKDYKYQPESLQDLSEGSEFRLGNIDHQN